jgi:hypothetical protein
LRASLDPLGSVVSHDLIVSPKGDGSGAPWSGSEGNRNLALLLGKFSNRGAAATFYTVAHQSHLRASSEAIECL